MRVNELLARSWWLGGRDRDIVGRFANRADAPGASPYLAMIVGRSLERMGERSRAIAYIERASAPPAVDPVVLQADRPLPEATAQMREMLASRNFAKASSLASELLERFPHSGDIHALAGDAALMQSSEGRALELYEVSARVRRSWPLTRKMIEAYSAAGDNLAAEVLLARYIAGDPHNIAALLLLAQNSAAREDWLRVEVLLDSAIASGAGNDLEVLSLRSDAARVQGRDKEAARFDAAYRALKPAGFIAE